MVHQGLSDDQVEQAYKAVNFRVPWQNAGLGHLRPSIVRGVKIKSAKGTTISTNKPEKPPAVTTKQANTSQPPTPPDQTSLAGGSVNGGKMRGYKTREDGSVTTYFNRDLTEVCPKLACSPCFDWSALLTRPIFACLPGREKVDR